LLHLGSDKNIQLSCMFVKGCVLSSPHILKSIMKSKTSEPRQGAAMAARFSEPRGSGLFKGRAGPQVVPLYFRKPFGFADESGVPGRRFRGARRHPPAQSTLLSRKQRLRVRGTRGANGEPSMENLTSPFLIHIIRFSLIGIKREERSLWRSNQSCTREAMN
jgi:hypothetical protein